MVFECVEFGLGPGQLGFDDGELIEVVGKVVRLVCRHRLFASLARYVIHITKRIGTNRALC